MKTQLQQAAEIIRQSLEEIQFSPYYSDKGWFLNFPEGSCEYASLYLARYLISEGVCKNEDIKVPAKNISDDEGRTHSWLKIRDRWHVDITADQYGNQFPKVIVTEDSDFHEGFQPMIWDSFEEADHFVFELLGERLSYIRTTWKELQNNLPSLEDGHPKSINE